MRRRRIEDRKWWSSCREGNPHSSVKFPKRKKSGKSLKSFHPTPNNVSPLIICRNTFTHHWLVDSLGFPAAPLSDLQIPRFRPHNVLGSDVKCKSPVEWKMSQILTWAKSISPINSPIYHHSTRAAAVTCAVSFTHISHHITIIKLWNILYPPEIIISGGSSWKEASFKAPLLCRSIRWDFPVHPSKYLSVGGGGHMNDTLQMMDSAKGELRRWGGWWSAGR